jgi:hypothetical protein
MGAAACTARWRHSSLPCEIGIVFATIGRFGGMDGGFVADSRAVSLLSIKGSILVKCITAVIQ